MNHEIEWNEWRRELNRADVAVQCAAGALDMEERKFRRGDLSIITDKSSGIEGFFELKLKIN